MDKHESLSFLTDLKARSKLMTKMEFITRLNQADILADENVTDTFVKKHNLRKLTLSNKKQYVWLQYRGNRVYKVFYPDLTDAPLCVITQSPLAFHLGNNKYRFLEMIYDFS